MLRLGSLDILVNNAGIIRDNLIHKMTDEDWDAARKDEVDLVLYLTRAAWPHLRNSRGTVVNMASLNGQISFKLLASLSHTTNKAAIIGLLRPDKDGWSSWDWQLFFDERAGIAEFDGGLSRAAAEASAFTDCEPSG